MPKIRPRTVGISEPIREAEGMYGILGHLGRVLPGRQDSRNGQGGRRSGATQQSRARLHRAWRELEARKI